MVTAQSSSIDILPDADEEDCGIIIWWRRKPLPLNFKCNEIKRIKTFSLVFQGKTLGDPDRVTNKSDSHLKFGCKYTKNIRYNLAFHYN